MLTHIFVALNYLLDVLARTVLNSFCLWNELIKFYENFFSFFLDIPIKLSLTYFLLIVECLVALGYKREDIEASLAQTRYDDVHATYLLISRKNTDVSRFTGNIEIIFAIFRTIMNENMFRHLSTWTRCNFLLFSTSSRSRTARDRVPPFHYEIWLGKMPLKLERIARFSHQLTGESIAVFQQQVRILQGGHPQEVKLCVSHLRLPNVSKFHFERFQARDRHQPQMEPQPVVLHQPQSHQLHQRGLQCKTRATTVWNQHADECFVYPCRSSNFKRQNTIDAASIKENTARLASQNQRPISAQPKASADSGSFNKIDRKTFISNQISF